MMVVLMIGIILVISAMVIKGTEYQNFQIAGVMLAPDHAESSQVKALQKQFKRQVVALAVVFSILFLVSQAPIFYGWRDFLNILFLFGFLIMVFVPIYRLHHKISQLKSEQQWVYSSKQTVVDLSVSREKGKAAPAKQWVWLSWLPTWLPLFIAILSKQSWPVVLLTALIPLLLLLLPLSYPLAIRTRTPFVSDDSQVAKNYMQQFERLHGLAYIGLTLSVAIFFIVLSAMMLWNPMSVWTIPLVLVFLIVLIGIMATTANRSRALTNQVAGAQGWQMTATDTYYVWGFYSNPNDARLFVPKQMAGMGTTINVAHPVGKIIAVVTGIFIVGLIIWVLAMTLINYQINITADSLVVDVPMYRVEVPFDAVEAIELSQKPLDGVRTNGFGGQDKRYGYFTLADYGAVRLYTYPENDWHIDILLDDSFDPQWLIYNEMTVEETQALYEELLAAWEEGQ
ncbi:DUF5808 domain-containing protein [Fundicoccus sp. Sow4_H7]|uniref:DUF5808 domain-containing protein n=1 Tax=Fundicoccus sp. Sow4_H7 TaxID=3438784 RepID=UPI003F92E57D